MNKSKANTFNQSVVHNAVSWNKFVPAKSIPLIAMKTSLANGNLSVLLLQARTFSSKAVFRVETCHTSCPARSDFIFRVCKTERKLRHSKQERAVTEALLPSAINCADINPCCDHLYFSTLVGNIKVKHSISITDRGQRKNQSFRFKAVWIEASHTPPPPPNSSPPLKPPFKRH